MPRTSRVMLNLLKDLDKLDRDLKGNLRLVNQEIAKLKNIPLEEIDESAIPSLRGLQKSLRQSEILLTQTLSKSINLQKRI